MPQLPQLLWSVFVSTQVPLHLVWPVGQPATHCPFSQVSPEAQALKQPPQLLVSVLVLIHVP